MKVAISPVSEDNAIANLEARRRAGISMRARAAHGCVGAGAGGGRCRAQPAACRSSFYTALYHAMLAPSLFMDATAAIAARTTRCTRRKGFNFYSTFSLWDTYRAQHPLLTILQPAQRTSDFVHSLIAAQQASPYGMLPVWAYQGLETWCMIGYHAVPVIADAYVKGMRGYDADEALEAMVASASYGPYGGSCGVHEARLRADRRGSRGRLEDARVRLRRLDHRADGEGDGARQEIAAPSASAPPTGATSATRRPASCARARAPMALPRPRSIRAASGYGSDYTEGNAWQYSWYVPQDVAGLVAALGGDAAAASASSIRCSMPRSTRSSSRTWRTSPASSAGTPTATSRATTSPICTTTPAQPWRTQERLGQIMRQPVRAAPGRTGRQRRSRPDVGVVPVHRAGLLPGDARPATNM